MAVAGLDVGTTGCKCTVYDNRGGFLKEAYEEYVFPPECGDRELDAAVELQQACYLTLGLILNSGPRQNS